jgi:hypothetical protein
MFQRHRENGDAAICAFRFVIFITPRDPAWETGANSRTEAGTVQCNLACIVQADPDVVAAVRKLYPDLQGDEVQMFIDSYPHRIAFFTSQGHMSCRLTLKPIKISRCRIVHA